VQHEARTFIFPDVLERERQSSVFPLDNPYFAEGPSADDAEQAEVVEVYCGDDASQSGCDAKHGGRKGQQFTLAVEFDGFSLAVAHDGSR